MKKFIEKIKYGKDEIELSLYYQGGSEKSSETQIPSKGGPLPVADEGLTAVVDVPFPLSRCRVGATAGINKDFGQKESAVFHDASLNLAPRAGLGAYAFTSFRLRSATRSS